MLKIFPDKESLNHFAAEKFVEIAALSIEKRGRLTVALAGGSTPKALYQLLAGDEYKDKIEWRKVFFFFGDERSVLPDSDESNFRMARENLFQPLKKIGDENLFRWQTELENAEKTAEDYEKSIRDFFKLSENEFPRFDLILLGMGADGHTASLFPYSKALHETKKIAVANPVEKLDTTRLTLTFPVINNARNVIFLVSGEEKAETLRAVLEGEFRPEELPAQSVKPEKGELFWLADRAAAKNLLRS